MNIPDYPEWEPDSHMHLWTRVNKTIIKFVPEKDRVRMTIYSKPYAYRDDVVLEMKLRDAQRSLLGILAIENL